MHFCVMCFVRKATFEYMLYFVMRELFLNKMLQKL